MMARSDSPNAPQTPATPAVPTNIPPGTTTVVVERTVTNVTGGDAPKPPRQPQPPRTPASAASDVTAGPGGLEPVSAAGIARMIKPDTKFQVNVGITTVTTDGETIIHDRLRNANYRLNPSGTLIWSRISTDISFAELLATIRTTHSVQPDTSEPMVADFLAELINRGVLAAAPLTPQE